jgi:F-type H+-transporting ATPase subunit delta
MKISKANRNDAKALFRACFVDGVLNESRVRSVVEEVVSHKPRGYLGTLHHFRRLVKIDVDRRSARIENAVETSPQLMQQIGEALERRHGKGLSYSYWINPALVAGLRVRVGNDIYDGSVAARLQALSGSL